ncbi:MAG: DUF1492 domain-containing protein [Selenomonadales bacterium]|nr:DUF1492 domain-containing protein [Selenomonadales bacterium]
MNEVKRWLKSAWVLKKQIEANMDEITALRTLACRVTPMYKESLGGSKENRTENTVARIVDLESDIRRDTEKLVRRVEEIRTAIERIDDERCRVVLTKRYLTYMKWENIASEMHYSVKQIFRFHEKALRRIKITVK